MENIQIKHHLNDELLIAYAAGALPEAFSLIVATHISMCDLCRADLAAHESVGGAVLEDAGSAELSDDALARCLAAINELPAPVPAEPKAIVDSIFPEPLREYAGVSPDDVNWRPIGYGVKQAILPSSKDASVRLLYIPGGIEMPDHGHQGTELTLVLQGAFRDEFDRFGVGDVEIAGPEDEHTPVAEEGEPCICLAAADARLKFNSLIPKLAQPFLRI